MDKEQLDIKVKKLKNLKNYKHLSSEELEIKARELLFKDEMISSLTFCTKEEDKIIVERLIDNYLSKISIENMKDIEMLRELLDLELITHQLKEFIKDGQTTKNGAIDSRSMEQLRDNSNLILSYKEKLGLLTDKKEENDAVRIIEKLKERFHKWINQPENRSNYETACPSCGENILIRRRLDKEKDEVKAHPWFIAGGILFNKEIFKDYNEGKLTEDQIIRYLDIAPDYLKWIERNYPLNQDKNDTEVD
jgi:hypothetical protein